MQKRNMDIFDEILGVFNGIKIIVPCADEQNPSTGQKGFADHKTQRALTDLMQPFYREVYSREAAVAMLNNVPLRGIECEYVPPEPSDDSRLIRSAHVKISDANLDLPAIVTASILLGTMLGNANVYLQYRGTPLDIKPSDTLKSVMAQYLGSVPN